MVFSFGLCAAKSGFRYDVNSWSRASASSVYRGFFHFSCIFREHKKKCKKGGKHPVILCCFVGLLLLDKLLEARFRFDLLVRTTISKHGSRFDSSSWYDLAKSNDDYHIKGSQINQAGRTQSDLNHLTQHTNICISYMYAQLLQ